MAQTAPNPYFARFPTFNPSPNTPLLRQFKDLAASQGWTPGSTRFKTERKQYILSEYDRFFGPHQTAATRLAGFQAMCGQLGIAGPPPSISKCKKALKGRRFNVNMIDLVDSLRGVGNVRIFGDLADLQDYTTRNKKWFPKDIAKDRKELAALLRVIGAG